MSEDGGAARLILLHKQKTSARTRFLRFAGSAMAFAPLPASARLVESGSVRPHPAAHLRAAELRLALPAETLEAIPDFQCEVETADGSLPILLAAFNTIDPPFAAAEAAGGRFVSITEMRDLPPIELDLLRKAYELLIG